MAAIGAPEARFGGPIVEGPEPGAASLTSYYLRSHVDLTLFASSDWFSSLVCVFATRTFAQTPVERQIAGVVLCRRIRISRCLASTCRSTTGAQSPTVKGASRSACQPA